ncbi:MAG: hypothetical protein ACRD0K_04120 [Egibacteraceae bacterium]
MTVELAAILLSWVAIVLLGLALAGVLRQLHQLRAQLEGAWSSGGPRPGQQLPPELAGAGGLLLFASRACGACTQVLPEAARIAGRAGWSAEVFYRGEPDAVELPGMHVRGAQHALFDALGVTVTPFAVVASGGRVVAAAPIGSLAALRALASKAEEPSHAPSA